jgi:hypothetical protein
VALVGSILVMAFVVGMNLVTSADSASPSGTSIPVTKGGTGATDKTNALKNLLPDLAGNDGKVLGLNSGTPTWVEQSDGKYFVSPDYAKIDSVNHITTNNGTWTVDKAGYVYLYGAGTNSTVIRFLINGVDTGGGDIPVAGSGLEGGTSTRGFNNAVIPVSVGDIIRIFVVNGTFQEATCRYIHPKYSTPPQPIVVDEGESGSYLLNTEIKTADTWINSKPIYKNTISAGVLPNSASKDVAHGIANIDNIIEYAGVAYDTNGLSYPLPYASPENVTWSITMLANRDTLTIKTGTDKTAFVGYVTVYYTKTTD